MGKQIKSVTKMAELLKRFKNHYLFSSITIFFLEQQSASE